MEAKMGFRLPKKLTGSDTDPDRVWACKGTSSEASEKRAACPKRLRVNRGKNEFQRFISAPFTETRSGLYRGRLRPLQPRHFFPVSGNVLLKWSLTFQARIVDVVETPTISCLELALNSSCCVGGRGSSRIGRTPR